MDQIIIALKKKIAHAKKDERLFFREGAVAGIGQ